MRDVRRSGDPIERDLVRRRMVLGAQVFGGLVALDALEYWIGIARRRGALIPLIFVGMAQAWLIARYYMHIRQLRRGEA